MKRRIGILTSGGDCPGLNATIRGVAKACYQMLGTENVEIVGISDGYYGLIHNICKEMKPDDFSGILTRGGTILGTKRQPFKMMKVIGDDNIDKVKNMKKTYQSQKLDCLLTLGGNGTHKTSQLLSEEGLNVIGLPKTIDNDINFIPHSFGFETAVDKAADAIRCAHIEAASVFNGIGIVKLMGRESGFIAANASLSMREVNFVLVPEVPFSLYGERGLFPALEKCLAAHSHAVLAVAEGAGQDLLSEHETRCDASGNKALGDITGFLRAKIAEYFSAKKIPYYLKYIDPSYMIRSVPANANDRLYCGFLGQHAVHAAMSGKTGMVVANIMDKFVHLPLELVTRKRRTMSVRSDLWQSVLETTGQGDVMGTSPEPEQHL